VRQNLDWKGDEPSSYSNGIRLKTNEDTIGTPEEGVDLIEFLNTINNGPDRLSKVDTDLMMRYFAALVLTSNMDSYIGFTANNYYLYHHISAGGFTLLPWDFNLGYGAFTRGGGFFGGGGSCDDTEHVIDNIVNDRGDRPLVDALFERPELVEAYKNHLRELLDGPYRPDVVEAEILRLADLIDPFVKADPTFYFSYDEWRFSLQNDMPANSSNRGGRGGGFFGPARGLIPFIKARNSNILRQLNGEIPSSNGGNKGSACP